MPDSDIEIPPQTERAPHTPVKLDNVLQPVYGRFLEDFEVGAIFDHPRGLTLSLAFAQEFATTFMQANPLYLNQLYARTHGFEDMLVSPLMVLNVALSMGVQNLSEQAIAHLGYYDVLFPHPVYAGDTLRSQSQVISRRFRGEGKPGIVRVLTKAYNHRDEVVVSYQRAILIPLRDAQAGGETEVTAPPQPTKAQRLHLPPITPKPIAPLSGEQTFFEDFAAGDIIVHANGRTVTDEHLPWTYRLGNTHPLHYDRLYSAGRSGPMSGEPIVYGGLVFAWLEGLASRDTSDNALWDLGYTEGYHTQPVTSGDTLYAVSRMLASEDGPPAMGAGMVTLQLIGLKNLSGRAALEKYQQQLFQKESAKPHAERIVEKCFEIERRLLVKRRGAWS